MAARIGHTFAGLSAIVLVVVALWLWGQATSLTADNTRPDVACWAVRSGAVSAAAAAQLLLLTFVIRGDQDSIYRRRAFGRDLIRVAFGLVCSVALVSAIALGLAGR